MFPCIETIRLEHGVFHNLFWHQRRVNRTYRDLYSKTPSWTLEGVLLDLKVEPTGLYKTRIIYDRQGVKSVELLPYQNRIVTKIILKEVDYIDYHFKYQNREVFSALTHETQPEQEVLIVRSGIITDLTYANVAFHNGKRWITPDQPLLRGTMRDYLLSIGALAEHRIGKKDLQNFKGFAMINAMVGFRVLENVQIISCH